MAPDKTATTTEERLALLREKKRQSQILNQKEILSEQKRQKIRSVEFKNREQEVNNEEEKPDEPENSLDWSVAEWDAWDLKQRRKNKEGGYKNLSDLAHNTYKKEISRAKIDKEKYKSQANSGSSSLFENRPEKEDIEGVSLALKDASERRQKRRRTEDAGDYVTEKNRQFNMKLDRQYGKSGRN